ncbi:MAG: GatB/YqeY domain-containing protein [Clostridia bacterium]
MDINDFKKAKIEAMKARDKVTIGALEIVITKLMTLIIDKRAKEETLTDNDTVSVLQKVVKELMEEREGFIKADRKDNIEILSKQIEIISSYLPKMLSKDEIKNIISKLDDKTIPSVMKHFKQNFQGKCNMQDVNAVLRSL